MHINLPPQFDDLKPRRQFVCWRPRPKKDGRISKIPVNPRTGYQASTTNPETWGTYEECEALLAVNPSLGGLGIVTGQGIGAIDLDDCFVDGIISDFAIDVLDAMSSYAELSPSGRGVHILCRLDDSVDVQRRNDTLGIEMYSKVQFVTLTGHMLADIPIAERTAQFNAVFGRCIADYDDDDDVLLSADTLEPLRRNSQYPVRTDDQVLAALFSRAKNADKCKLLYDGQWQGLYESQSSADLALANALLEYSDGDLSQTDRLFRASGLMRGKWDEKRGDITYGDRTLRKAAELYRNQHPASKMTPPSGGPSVASSMETVRPEPSVSAGVAPVVSEKKPTAQEKKGSNEPSPSGGPPVVSNQKSQVPVIKDISGILTFVEKLEGTVYPIISTTMYDEQYLDEDIAILAAYADRRTGFEFWDKEQGAFLPGLYVIAAPPAGGKTTFCLQMGDQLAAAGEHVLYFSLEIPPMVMHTKSLTRIMATDVLEPGKKMTAKQLRLTPDFARNPDILRARAIYKERVGNRMHIVQAGGFMTTVGDVVTSAVQYSETTGVTPVVFVDYLQVLHSPDVHMSVRDSIDNSIKALKSYQMMTHGTVIVVSSVSRENYLMPMGEDAYKESGGVEFTADHAFCLELNCVSAPNYPAEGTKKERQRIVRAAQTASVREVVLKCLKTRDASLYNTAFLYHCATERFESVEKLTGKYDAGLGEMEIMEAEKREREAKKSRERRY